MIKEFLFDFTKLETGEKLQAYHNYSSDKRVMAEVHNEDRQMERAAAYFKNLIYPLSSFHATSSTLVRVMCDTAT